MVKDEQLGSALIKRKLLSADEFQIALIEQKKTGQKLTRVLKQYGFVKEEQLQLVLASLSGVKSVNLRKLKPKADALKLLEKDFARRYQLLPLRYVEKQNTLIIAMADPANLMVRDKVQRALFRPMTLQAVQAGESELVRMIDAYYGAEASLANLLERLFRGGNNTNLDLESNTLRKLVNYLLDDAVKRNVSDIHLEPERGYIRIRYRIDGVLRSICSLHNRYWPAIVGRIKVLCGLDIAENRLPQDGSFSYEVHQRTIDFRVSTFPVQNGENLVIRILDRNKTIPSFDQLISNPNSRALLKKALLAPEGLILVAGPTGSGKTTTLYTLLSELNSEAVNIMTLEDPVEYPMELARQSSIGKGNNIDFSDGIRAILRQDPDIILIGEIRDESTANIALRSVMTGHKVLASIHSRSAMTVVQRLLDLSVKPSVLAGNITAIIAQRLLRTSCKSCGGKNSGCVRCEGSGYTGRTAVMEVLTLDQELDSMLLTSSSFTDIEKKARSKGWLPLLEQGRLLVSKGLTDQAELSRVLGAE